MVIQSSNGLQSLCLVTEQRFSSCSENQHVEGTESSNGFNSNGTIKIINQWFALLH